MTALIKVLTNAAGELRARLQIQSVPGPERAERAIDCTLVCSSEVEDLTPDYPTPKPGWGWSPKKRGFTKYARSTIREAGAVLDEWCGSSVLFATFTMPGDGRAKYLQLSRFSAYVVHRLRQFLSDKLPGYSCINVWELQGRGALHLHLAVGHPDREALESVGRVLPAVWCRVLGTVSRVSGVDVFANDYGQTLAWDWHLTRQDVQWATKCVGAYLSKYISKQASKAVGHCVSGPASWWGITNNLRKEVVARRLCAESDRLDPARARDVFESLTAFIKERYEKVFSYGNRERPRDAYLVAFANKVQGTNNFSDAVRHLFSTCAEVLDTVQDVEAFDWVGHLARLSGVADVNAPLPVSFIANFFGAVTRVGVEPAMG